MMYGTYTATVSDPCCRSRSSYDCTYSTYEERTRLRREITCLQQQLKDVAEQLENSRKLNMERSRNNRELRQTIEGYRKVFKDMGIRSNEWPCC